MSTPKSCRLLTIPLILATLSLVVATNETIAQRGNGGGGGGGGGGGSTTPTYSIVELPVLSLQGYKVTNPDAMGYVTVVGEGGENSYVSAALARVRVSDRSVTSFFLPEPTDNSPLGDIGSNAYDVNQSQVAVGACVLHGGSADDGIVLPTFWAPANTPSGFAYSFLPLLDGYGDGEARGVNDAGWMVGRCDLDVATSTAVLWSPGGAAVYDLNETLPENSDWYLTEGFRINQADEVIGRGYLHGVETGFRMGLTFGIDPETNSLTILGDIEAIPLVEGADKTTVYAISPAGAVLAGQRRPTDPALYRMHGSIWRGTGTAPELLPSAADGPATVRGINAQGTIVGDSTVLGISLIDGDAYRATLFRPLTGGGFQAIDLNGQVPTKPSWYLRYAFGINDQGWIVARGRKFDKGVYSWKSVLLVPNR